MTVGDMRTRMTEVEYLHWAAYHRVKAQRAELEQLKGKGG